MAAPGLSTPLSMPGADSSTGGGACSPFAAPLIHVRKSFMVLPGSSLAMEKKWLSSLSLRSTTRPEDGMARGRLAKSTSLMARSVAAPPR